MKKSNLNVFTYDYYPWKHPINWFRNIRQFFRNVKWAWQRATKGFSDRDTWNMDFYYAELFADSLKYLAENSHGYPGELDKLVKDSTSDAGAKEWERLLLEASENFRNYNKDESLEEIDLYEVYENLRNMELIRMENSDGSTTVKFGENSPEAEKARKAWLKANKDFHKYKIKCKDDGFEFLKNWFEGLWD